MYLDLLKDTIRDSYDLGPSMVFIAVQCWLESRGVKPSTEGLSEITIVDRVSEIDTQQTISQKELQALRFAQAELDALYAEGVDNWDGYQYAMDSLND